MIPNTPGAWDERAALFRPWDAALWSENGQATRFYAALDRIDPKSGDTLLDFGCGPGSLCEFLPLYVGYSGWDWSEGMRARASSSYPHAEILESEPTLGDSWDHVVCIGPFNLSENWSKEQTYRILSALWAFSARKSLTACLYRGDMVGHLSYDPTELVLFAQSYCDLFVVDAGYLANDVMLHMRRNP